ARLSRLFLFFEDRIELCAGHLQFVRMFVDPLGQGIIFCRRPTSFEFGAVLPQAIELEVEGIFEIGEFCRDDCRLGEDGGDKDDAVGFSENKVAGKDGGAADANGSVDRGERHLGPGRGIIAAIEAVEVGDFAVFFGVADAGIEDKAGVGMGCDAAAEVRADQGSFDDLAEAVGHVDVADLKLVDGPAVISTDASFSLALGGDRLDHVGAQWHVLRSEGAAGKGFFRMEGLEATVKLALVAELAEILPDVFDGDVESPLEEVVGNLWAAVRKAFALPVGCIEHHLFLRHLYLRRSGNGGGKCAGQDGRANQFSHRWLSPEELRERVRSRGDYTNLPAPSG